MNFENVCVAGLGQVGLPTASYIAEKGFQVVGYDIDESKVRSAKESGLHATRDWNEIPGSDAYVVCVSTSWRTDGPDFSALQDIAGRIRGSAKRGALISVESTTLPGACRGIFGSKLPETGGLVHVPHRYWAGDPKEHGVRQLRVIGALDQASMRLGRAFYETNLDIPLEVVEPLEIAELSKIVENSHRYVQIAFAEEVRMICDASNLDFETLRRACNSKWNVDVLEARDGIFGHCLPKDIEYLRHIAGSEPHLLTGAAEADRAYRESIQAKRRLPSSRPS